MRPGSFSLNPYEVLGVSPNASNEEIQVAYRQHALRWHPDRNPNDEYSMRMMQRVNAAWSILKDEESRAAYDRWERGEANTASGPDAWGTASAWTAARQRVVQPAAAISNIVPPV